MTKLLQKALAKVGDLPPAEQNAIAKIVLDEIAAEAKWEAAIAKSPQKLQKLAERAWDEHSSGKTRKLDVRKL